MRGALSNKYYGYFLPPFLGCVLNLFSKVSATFESVLSTFFGLFCFGFFASRLPRFCPLAIFEYSFVNKTFQDIGLQNKLAGGRPISPGRRK